MTLHPGRVPVLTLWRPWPALILRAGKRVENRGYQTRYRGPIFLHAGQTWDPHAITFASHIPAGDTSTAAHWISEYDAHHPTGIVGIATLTATQLDNPSPWAIPGEWHWILDNDVHEFPTPVPCKGKQGLWAAPPGLWPALRVALESIGR